MFDPHKKADELLANLSPEEKEATYQTLKRFTFHKPDAEGVAKMRTIRKHVRELAAVIQIFCPESREKATALTQLSFVMMSANSAIVQQYPIDEADL